MPERYLGPHNFDSSKHLFLDTCTLFGDIARERNANDEVPQEVRDWCEHFLWALLQARDQPLYQDLFGLTDFEFGVKMDPYGRAVIVIKRKPVIKTLCSLLSEDFIFRDLDGEPFSVSRFNVPDAYYSFKIRRYVWREIYFYKPGKPTPLANDIYFKTFRGIVVNVEQVDPTIVPYRPPNPGKFGVVFYPTVDLYIDVIYPTRITHVPKPERLLRKFNMIGDAIKRQNDAKLAADPTFQPPSVPYVDPERATMITLLVREGDHDHSPASSR